MQIVADWIERKRITRTDFAALIGANKSQVTRWLNKTNKPTVTTLKRISKVTGLSLDQLAK